MSLLLCTGVVGAADRVVYFDSSNTNAGDGSFNSPFRLLTAVSWPAVNARLAAGDTVTLQLKRGSVFREQFNINASGRPGQPLMVDSYGSGAKPAIRGDTRFTTWAASAGAPGLVWVADAPSQPDQLWDGETSLRRGSASVPLNDREWVWLQKKLYYRDDRGNPDALGLTLQGSTLGMGIYIRGQSNVMVSDLQILRMAADGFRATQSQGVVVEACDFRQSGTGLHCENSPGLEVRRCLFQESSRQGLNIEGGGSTVRVFFSLFRDNLFNSVTVSGCNAVDFLNCTMAGVGARHLDNASAGSIRVVNCVLSGTANVGATSGGETLRSQAGIVTLGHSCVLPNLQDPARFLTGITDAGGNLFTEPRYISTRREGIYVITEDDYPTTRDWARLADLARAHGFRTTLSLSDTDTVSPGDRALIQQKLNEGHDVVSHTRSHSKLTETRSLSLQYVGTGVSCALSITNQRLRTVVEGGQPGENLDLDLTKPPYDRESALVQSLDRLPAYVCSEVSSYNHAVPTRLLAEVSLPDIKPVPTVVSYDSGKFYTNEILSSKQDIQQMFTNLDGSAYVCASLNYPGGYFNDTVVGQLQAAGYEGARTAGQVGSTWLLEKMDLFALKPAPASQFGHMLLLTFRGNADDASSAANHFWPSNVVYVTPGYRLGYAAFLNGTNAFLRRPGNASFDFSKGDWYLSTKLKPSGFDREATLYSQASDDGNCCRLTIAPGGHLHFFATGSGKLLVDLTSTNTLAGTGLWQSVSVQQLGDAWRLSVNGQRETFTNSTRLPASLADIYIGCSYDPFKDITTRFYGGQMADFMVSNGTWRDSHAVFDGLCEAGGIYEALTHGESSLPREIWNIALNAATNYSGRLRVMTQTEALRYIRASGVLLPGGRTVVRSGQVDLADYRLRPDSPARFAGDVGALVGIAGLRDMNGRVVTDSQGGLAASYGTISMGAFESGGSALALILPGAGSDPILSGVDSVNLAVSASAVPPDATRIEFWADGVKVAQCDPSAASAVWNGPPAGLHRIQAKVLASDEQPLASNEVSIQVVNPTSFRLRIAPAANGELQLNLDGGNTNRFYTVERSFDLNTWQVVDAIKDAEGSSITTAPLANQPAFYRARLRGR